MEDNNMEQKRNLLMPLLIVFVLLSLILGGYIVYDKVLKKDGNTPKEETTPPTSTPTNQESSLPEWANYLLNQNITSIKYGYPSYINESLECNYKDITKDQLKLILEKMTASKLRKEYTGGSGSECNDEGILIKYGDNKKLLIDDGFMIWASDTDQELLDLLDKDVDSFKEKDAYESDLIYVYEWEDNYIYSLLGIK